MSYPRLAPDGHIIKHEDKEVGICFGRDFTSEHEWGFAPLRKAFGQPLVLMNQFESYSDFALWRNKRHGILGRLRSLFQDPMPVMGLDKYRVLSVPESLKWHTSTVWGREGFGYKDFGGFDQRQVNDFAGKRFNQRFLTGWSEGSFIALASERDDVKALRRIYNSVFQKDAAFIPGGVFPNTRGLCLVRASAVPDIMRGALHAYDLEQFERERARFEQTVQRLKEEGKHHGAQ